MRSVTDLLLVAYVLLVPLVSRGRKIGLLALTISGCGLAMRYPESGSPSAPVNLADHTISATAFVVQGYVVAYAVFAPAPGNTRRILGSIVFISAIAEAARPRDMRASRQCVAEPTHHFAVQSNSRWQLHRPQA